MFIEEREKFKEMGIAKYFFVNSIRFVISILHVVLVLAFIVVSSRFGLLNYPYSWLMVIVGAITLVYWSIRELIWFVLNDEQRALFDMDYSLFGEEMNLTASLACVLAMLIGTMILSSCLYLGGVVATLFI